MSELIPRSEMLRLREWTDARIALGRVGASMPTKANLDFGADHAAARDAVHSKLNVKSLTQDLESAGFLTLSVRSQAESRAEYLRRPDLGRRLHPSCYETLRCDPLQRKLVVVVGDGLSAEAPQRYAVPLLQQLRPLLPDWTMDSIVIAEQARVALGDEIGSLRGAEAVLVLLGERPGLKAADSLGAYLTYAPHAGLTDASRNCVSSIREGGLSISSAVTKLVYLLNGARALGRSGVVLKDNSESPQSNDSLPGRKSLGLNAS
jgi:ethanolamine ammonia-lyase small subunit